MINKNSKFSRKSNGIKTISFSKELRQKDYYFEFETFWRPFIVDLGHQRFRHKVKFVY